MFMIKSRLEDISNEIEKRNFNFYITINSHLFLMDKYLHKDVPNLKLTIKKPSDKNSPLCILSGTYEDINIAKIMFESNRTSASLKTIEAGYITQKGYFDGYEQHRIPSSSIPEVINSRLKILEMYERYTPGFCEAYLEVIDKVLEDDLRKVREFSEHWAKFERLQRFTDLSRMARFFKGFYDTISLGQAGANRQKDMEKTAENYIAWSILEKAAEENSLILDEDLIYLKGDGNNELAEKLKITSDFLSQSSSKAYHGRNRMKELNQLQLDNFSVYGIKPLFEDVDGLKQKIIERVF